MTKETGGPAFPTRCSNQTDEPIEGFDNNPIPAHHDVVYAGLSIRDHFAGLAMQGMLANPNQDYAPLTLTSQQSVVEGAYEMADAMLQERNKP